MRNPYELSYFTGGLYGLTENDTSYGFPGIFVRVPRCLRTGSTVSSYGFLSVFVRGLLLLFPGGFEQELALF